MEWASIVRKGRHIRVGIGEIGTPVEQCQLRSLGAVGIQQFGKGYLLDFDIHPDLGPVRLELGSQVGPLHAARRSAIRNHQSPG